MQKSKFVASCENVCNMLTIIAPPPVPMFRKYDSGGLLIREMHDLGTQTIIATFPGPIGKALICVETGQKSDVKTFFKTLVISTG